MFGRNIVVKPIWDVDNVRHAALLGDELLVHSIWPTIQGEGPHAGEPAVFIRLSGCNLRCHFCDTEFESGRAMTISDIVKQVKIAMQQCNTDLIVLTGGEPMRQQIIPLLARFDDEGWLSQIETAGTVWPPEAEVSEEPEGTPFRRVTLDSLLSSGAVEIVCSPKTPKVHEKIERWCQHFKYIIREGEIDPVDGLPNRSTQVLDREARLYRPDSGNALPTIWVQPMQEYKNREPAGAYLDNIKTLANTSAVARIAMKHGYRVSLQQHRILGVD